MKGFLSINTKGWAIQNVMAEPKNDTTGVIMKIQQSYEFIQGHWFPSQLNTDIIFTNVQVAAGEHAFNLVGKGRSYIKDINLSPGLKKSDFGFHEVEIAVDATKKKGEFWQEYRTDSLTARELETYRVIDSIGKAENFDKMASTFQTLMVGRIPIKCIDIDLDKTIHYNDYEGIYLGLGIHTNDLFSKKVKLGGYWGYGFSDQRAKYGLDINLKVHKPSESNIQLDLYNSVSPSGAVSFFDDRSQIWKPDYFYQFFVSRMNPTMGGALNFAFRVKPMRDFKWNIGFRAEEKQAYGSYVFGDTSDVKVNPLTQFSFTEISLGFRFAFRERIIQTTKGALYMGSKYPTIWFNYSRGLEGIMENSFVFNRFDLKIEDEVHIRYLGDFSYKIMAGYIDGVLPISNLYNAPASYRQFALYAPSSFGTMRSNEFFSDRYISLFMSHNFGNFLFTNGTFKPELVLVTNIAFGDMNNQINHNNIQYKTMEMGYYESGVFIRKLLDLKVYDLGAGVLYRYGPYGFDRPAKNFAYKISLFYAF